MDDEDGSEHDRHDFDRQRVGVDASVEEDSELDATTVDGGEAHEQANDDEVNNNRLSMPKSTTKLR